jgi:hypothetical protein
MIDVLNISYPTLTLPDALGRELDFVLISPLSKAGLFHSLKGAHLQAFPTKKSGD